MAKIIREYDEIEGTLHTVVSLFDMSVSAYDVSNETDETINRMLDTDDIEAFAEENGIAPVEMVEMSDGSYGTDLYPVEGQSTAKCIVDDICLREVFEGGFAEYVSDFDETFEGIEWLKGGIDARFSTPKEGETLEI